MAMSDFDPGGGGGTPPPSYAHRVKQNGRRFEKLNRNILEVTVEKNIASQMVNLNGEMVANLCNVIGVNPACDTEGYQVNFRGKFIRVSIWAKQGLSLERFISEQRRPLGEGLTVTQVRPAMRREVTAPVSGLPFNIPDSQVINYFECFGGRVTHREAMYGTHKEGPCKNQYNGDRRFKVDFSDQKCSMGTYHLLGGSKIKIIYPGNQKTCGRCHQTSTTCVGGGIASMCAEREGERVPLMSHMKKLWEKVGYVPGSGEEASDEEDDREDEVRQREIVRETRETPKEDNHLNLSLSMFSQPLDADAVNDVTGPSTSTTSPITEITSSEDPQLSHDSPTDDTTEDGSHDTQNQKNNSSIKEKIDIFENDENKRKAEHSPELTKKEKKKLKNLEKTQRKQE